jgi:hypothetical protein
LFFSESSQCYIGGNSPADILTDDEDDQTNPNETSPHSDQTLNPSHSLSPSQITITNGIDDVSTTTPIVIKVEQDNDFNSSSPSSPSIQTLPNKITVTTSLPVSSSSNSNKRLTGTLNRLLHSVINRPNGHHYHQNGLSSSPSSSTTTTTTTTVGDGTVKEPKTSLEMSTQSIESRKRNILLVRSKYLPFYLAFVQHFDSSFNTMTYFQEKLQHLLVSIARKCFSRNPKQVFLMIIL